MSRRNSPVQKGFFFLGFACPLIIVVIYWWLVYDLVKTEQEVDRLQKELAACQQKAGDP